MAKSALEKLRTSPPPEVKVLDKDTPWAPAGAKMVISSPAEIDACLRRVPKGKVLRFEDLRAALAAKHGADITCPVTTGIFLNIAVAASQEAEAAGGAKPLSWWRVLKSNDELNQKAPGGVEAQRKKLEAEGIAVITKPRGKKLIVPDAESFAVAVDKLI